MSGEHLTVWTCDRCGEAVCEIATDEPEDCVKPTVCPAGFDSSCKWVIS